MSKQVSRFARMVPEPVGPTAWVRLRRRTGVAPRGQFNRSLPRARADPGEAGGSSRTAPLSGTVTALGRAPPTGHRLVGGWCSAQSSWPVAISARYGLELRPHRRRRGSRTVRAQRVREAVVNMCGGGWAPWQTRRLRHGREPLRGSSCSPARPTSANRTGATQALPIRTESCGIRCHGHARNVFTTSSACRPIARSSSAAAALRREASSARSAISFSCWAVRRPTGMSSTSPGSIWGTEEP